MKDVRVILNLYKVGAILEDVFLYMLESFCLASEGKPTKRFYRDEFGELIAY